MLIFSILAFWLALLRGCASLDSSSRSSSGGSSSSALLWVVCVVATIAVLVHDYVVWLLMFELLTFLFCYWFGIFSKSSRGCWACWLVVAFALLGGLCLSGGFATVYSVTGCSSVSELASFYASRSASDDVA